MNFGSGVNPITLAYAAVQGLHICFINVGSQKIARSRLLTHDMVLVNFQLKGKEEKIRFF